MDVRWFEDELEPVPGTIESRVEEVQRGGETIVTSHEMGKSARGIVRVDRPMWQPMGEASLTLGNPITLYKVRLRFQFDLKSENARFTSACCQAFIESVTGDEPHPFVYDLFPKDFYKDKPQVVSLKFKPSITVGSISATGVEIGTNIDVGEVVPEITANTGFEERAPYWKLRSKSYPLLGMRTFWLVLARPQECSGIRLRTRTEGQIQTKWGLFAVYPRERVWANRPAVVICN